MAIPINYQFVFTELENRYQQQELVELAYTGARDTTTKPLVRGFVRGVIQTPDGRPVMLGTSDIYRNTDTLTLTKSYLRVSGTDEQVRRAWRGGKFALPLAAAGRFQAGLVRAPSSASNYILWITNNAVDSLAGPDRTVFIEFDTLTYTEIRRYVADQLVVSAACYSSARNLAYFIGASPGNIPAGLVLNNQLQQSGILPISSNVARIQPPFSYLQVQADGSYFVAGRYSNLLGVWSLNADGSYNTAYPVTQMAGGRYAFSYDNGVLRAASYDTTLQGQAGSFHQYVWNPAGGWLSERTTPMDTAWGVGKPLCYLPAQNAWLCETGELPFGTVNGIPRPKYRFLAKSDGILTAFGKTQGSLGYSYSLGYSVKANPSAGSQILCKGNGVLYNGRVTPNFVVIQRNGEIDPAFTSSLRFPPRFIFSLGTSNVVIGSSARIFPWRSTHLATGNRLLFSTFFRNSDNDTSSLAYPDTLYRFGFDGGPSPTTRTIRGVGLYDRTDGGFALLTFLTASGAHRGSQQYQGSQYPGTEYRAKTIIVQHLDASGEFVDTTAIVDMSTLPDSLTNFGRYIAIAAQDDEGGIWLMSNLNSSLGSDGPGSRSFVMRLQRGKNPMILVLDSNYVINQIERVEVLPGKRFRFFGSINRNANNSFTSGYSQVALIDSSGHFLPDPEFPSRKPYLLGDSYGVRPGMERPALQSVLADGRIVATYQGDGRYTMLMFQRDGRLDPSFLPIRADEAFGSNVIGNTMYVFSPFTGHVNNLTGKVRNVVGSIAKNALYAFKLSSSPMGKGFIGGKVERIPSPVQAGQGCTPTGARVPVAGSVVTAGNQVALTDANGNYAVAVDTGRLTVAQSLPNDFLMRQVCPLAQAGRPVHISRQLQTVLGQDFINESYDCPRMTLNFSPGRMRLCSRNTAWVSYRNEGTAPQPDARLRLYLPGEMHVISSEHPFAREADGSYTFPLGLILPNQGGAFTIVDSISCLVPDTNLRVCYTARIEPMSPCGQITGSQISWDGAWVDARADYISSGPRAGQVRYRVVNRGQAMTDSVPLKIVTQNYYPAYSQKIKLAAGDSMLFYVGGGTTTMSQLFVGQTAGCPLGTGGSMGFAGIGQTPTFLSLQDGWFGRQTASQCFPIRFAFDPNEKVVYPEKQAEPGERLDYTIHFENYGNDTAFAVVVLDTLDANLDVTKFAFEGSSHPCTVTLTGTDTQPVLNFSFLPIALTAKKQDSVASKGFVKFALSLKPGVARGTFVPNRASIYFDRNPAVVTPYATIQVRTEDRVTAQTPVSSPTLLVAPNPSQGSFRVVVPQGSYGRQLAIRDVAGRLIRTVSIQGNTAEVSGLAAGMYTVQVEGLKAARVVVNR